MHSFSFEIKPSDHIRNNSPRALADKLMREKRFEDLGDRVHIASFYGMSSLGDQNLLLQIRSRHWGPLTKSHTEIG